jgi:Fe2+ transport system protein FeoA
MNARQMLRLSSLASGQRARVIDVISRDPAQAHRLSCLGVTPGVIVTVLQTFPGVIFQCDETELAIEPDVARSIVVELTGA